jgi:hypothetical protein
LVLATRARMTTVSAAWAFNILRVILGLVPRTHRSASPDGGDCPLR